MALPRVGSRSPSPGQCRASFALHFLGTTACPLPQEQGNVTYPAKRPFPATANEGGTGDGTSPDRERILKIRFCSAKFGGEGVHNYAHLGKTRDHVAELIGISHFTYESGKKVLSEESPPGSLPLSNVSCQFNNLPIGHISICYDKDIWKPYQLNHVKNNS